MTGQTIDEYARGRSDALDQAAEQIKALPWIGERDRLEPPVVYVHGLPASSLAQVIDFLTGDDHDRSKVQIVVNGRFYDFQDLVDA